MHIAPNLLMPINSRHEVGNRRAPVKLHPGLDGENAVTDARVLLYAHIIV